MRIEAVGGDAVVLLVVAVGAAVGRVQVQVARPDVAVEFDAGRRIGAELAVFEN